MDAQKIDTDIDLFDPERQYRDFYDNAPFACFTVNTADGQVLNVNKEVQRLLGYPREAMLQKNVFELYADTLHGLPKAQKAFKDFKAGKSIRNIELQVKHRNGKQLWVSLSVEPEIDPAGNTAISRSMMIDISDRKESEIALENIYNDVHNLVDKHRAELVEENTRLKQEVEELKEAQISLRENVHHLHSLLNATTNLVFMLDLDGTVVTANEHACETYGKTLQELKGSNFFDLMPAEHDESRKKIAATVTQSKLPACYLEEIDGIFYSNIFYPILDEKGFVKHFSVFSEDVTPLKLAEKALKNSEKKFRLLVERMNEGLAILDENDLHTYVNDRFCAMVGYSREEIVGRPASALLDSANLKIFKSQIAARRSGERTVYEMELRHKNKSRISVIISPRPLLDEAGSYEGSFALITDISWMKRTEAALRESENSFKKLAENANDGILLIENDGKTVYANNWFERISGYSVAKILKGKGTTKLIDQAIGEMHLEKLRTRLAAEPAPKCYETEIITKTGWAVPVEFTASKTIWQGKTAVLLIVRDITSQKQTEAKLLREQIKLEERVKERTRELVDTNKALFVLARNIDKRREKFQEKASRIVNSKILPIIEGIQKNQPSANYRMEYDVLKAHLNELSHDSKDEPGVTFILSNAELRIANMIKNGFTSPQIARLLSISADTVKTHRKNIRKKLNIRNSKINLGTYLRAKLK